jgi:hypothetical protein
MARLRTRSQVKPQGRIQRNGVVGPIGQLVTTLSEDCEDVTGKGDNHRFIVGRREFSGGVINKLPWHTGLGRAAENWTCDAVTSGAVFGHLPVSGTLPKDTLAAQAAARTNPSRPYVDVPIMILELGDITKLLRDSTEFLAKRDTKGYAKFVATNNIRYQFGIAPLVGDLVKLLNFRDQVNRRIKEIEKLKTKGLRRTINFGSASASREQLEWLQSAYMTFTAIVSKRTTITQKVHVRWKPTGNTLKVMDDEAISVLARRAVLGLTLDASTFWELVPWSWLIDWNIAIGDLLKANRNIIPAQLDSMVYIEHTQTIATTPNVTDGSANGTCTAIHHMLEKKLREPVSLNPEAHLPFLDGRQLGILASLAIMRT